MDIAVLKVAAVQWLYLLFGLRDGHSDTEEKILWGPWTKKGQKQIRVGRVYRAQLARIVCPDPGHELVIKEFRMLTFFMSKDQDKEDSVIERPTSHVIEERTSLPPQSVFGLKRMDSVPLFFPAVPAQPQLWTGLKAAQSIKEVQCTVDEIFRCLAAASSGVRSMPQFRRALCDYPGKLLKARRLWNYPRTDRPTSDNKRIKFFAEALAGLMMEISPATATKKLTGWKPPRLWNRQTEGESLHEGI